MKTGSLIKFHRLNQGITQEALADGIISVSYLSRIENNQISPDEEVFQLLFVRLGINISESRSNEEEFLNLLNNWKISLLNYHKREIEEQLSKILEIVDNITNYDLYFKYSVFKIKYYLIKGDIKSAENLIYTLDFCFDDLKDENKYYFLKHKAIFLYYVKNFMHSEKIFHECIGVLHSVPKNFSEEYADVYYLYSLSLSKNYKDATAIYYAELSLDIYRENYNTKRCATCHLVLGLSYRRIQSSEEALIHYKRAKELAQRFAYDDIASQVEQNMGYLMSVQNKSYDAIYHFKSSYEYNKMTYSFEGLNSVLSIVKEYYSLGDMVECSKWVDEGYKFINYRSLTIGEKYYYLQLQCFNYVISQCDKEFELFMEDSMIPYLMENKMHRSLIFYSKILSQHYENHNKYKKSTYYLKLIIESYNNLFKL